MNASSQERISALLHPRNVALVGASDKSTFSALILGNLVAGGWSDRVHLVNARSTEVHGRPAHPTCVAIGEPIDLAVVMVPVDAVAECLRDAAAAGARSVSLLTSGYAEMGDQGRIRQQELTALAEELDLVILGPNSLGFINLHEGIRAMAQGDPPTEPGGVALISQSGASCGAMKDFAATSAVNLSHVITVGNESMVTVGHLVGALVDDDNVKAFAIFMEGIKDPDVFADAALRAHAAGKAVVVLKAGRSELAATAAASHTGALVGDDRVVDAMFTRLGIIRVDTIEDMLVTAGLAAHTGRLDSGELGVVSMSGGACDIIADLAEPSGVTIAGLAPETKLRLTEELPEYGHPNNPLDITGAGVIDPGLWTRSIEAVGADPSVGIIAAVHSLPLGHDDSPFYGQKYVSAIGEGLRLVSVPSVYVTQVTQPIGRQAMRALEEARIPHVVPGMRLALDAIGRIRRWSQQEASWHRPSSTSERPAGVANEPLSEAQARGLLERAGIPVVPAVHARTAGEAVQAASEWAAPVAMKIVSGDIAHKTDIGGVRLNVAVPDVERAFHEILDACSGHGRLDGVLISPMRTDGIDLLVGVTRDPDWGLMLTVGFGGVLVEVLNDITLIPLPATADHVKRSLRELRGARLLDGVRGGEPVDLDSLARVVSSIGDLAESLGPSLMGVEINPLRVHGSRIEALDALIEWAQD